MWHKLKEYGFVIVTTIAFIFYYLFKTSAKEKQDIKKRVVEQDIEIKQSKVAEEKRRQYNETESVVRKTLEDAPPPKKSGRFGHGHDIK